MAGTDSEKTVWWEQQLPAITAQLARWVRGRSLPSDEADLVQDAVEALFRSLSGGGFPAPWYSPDFADEDGSGVRRLFGLAKVILHRRIADSFRRHAVRHAKHVATASMDELVDRHVPLDRHAALRQSLAASIIAMAELSDAERDLIHRAAGLRGAVPDMDAKTRQRLHRARAKLRKLIEKNVGADALELLKRT